MLNSKAYRSALKLLSTHWRWLMTALAPLMLVCLPALWTSVPMNVRLCAYVLLLMAIYWTTAPFSIYVTSLLPVLLFPILGIMSAQKTAMSYVNNISFLSLGSYTASIAFEITRLHKRIALQILVLTGNNLLSIQAGVMLVTAFLSMWMSNTATTAMMLPVMMALMTEFVQAKNSNRNDIVEFVNNNSQNDPTYDKNLQDDTMFEKIALKENELITLQNGHKSSHHSFSAENRKSIFNSKTLTNDDKRLCRGLLLSVCYSANLGGTATLTGTPSNLVMTGILEDRFKQTSTLNFATWMAFGFPGMLINLFAAWLLLQFAFFGSHNIFNWKYLTDLKSSNLKVMLRNELNKLGPITFAEKSVFLLFLSLITMWLLRTQVWGKYFAVNGEILVSDATSAMFIVFIMFLWPRNSPFANNNNNLKDYPAAAETSKSFQTLLTWNDVEARFRWGLWMLLGAGFALSRGVEETGLSQLIANGLASLNISTVQMSLVTVVIATLMTEFTSNTATTTIICPILLDVAQKLCINPLYLMVSATTAASFAFMLPVATTPNALVFSQGVVRVVDMIWVGFIMNCICVAEVLLAINTWAYPIFDLYSLPTWTNFTNCFQNVTNETIAAIATN